ncbi:hypothetical protein SCALM49S_01035 [Streptomyces californicus]
MVVEAGLIRTSEPSAPQTGLARAAVAVGPAAAISRAGLSSATTLPATMIATRSQSASASSRWWVV